MLAVTLWAYVVMRLLFLISWLSIQSWVYVIIDDTPLISAIGGGSPITWSISTEWFFYLAYPFVAALILRACTVRRTVIFAVLWCALWIVISSGLYDRYCIN